MRSRTATAATLAIAFCLCAVSASAGPCGVEIDSFQRTLRHEEAVNPDSVGTAPQTIDAQLEHQPTPSSVQRAKDRAKAEIATVLARAEKLDAEGKQGECLGVLDTARLLLQP